jgi:signal peptidase I
MEEQIKPMDKYLNYTIITLMCIICFTLGMLMMIDSSSNISAPGDWIKQDQIEVTNEYIIIHIDNASLSSYADTGSMKPILDSMSNGIRIVPASPKDINKGDIISYDYQDDLIVHRVISKGIDGSGYWFTTQGDNNKISDDMKIRFDDIRYVTIGVLY